MLEVAEANKRRHQAENLRFVQCTYETLEFENEFDCALFFDSLHHAEDEAEALVRAHRALRPGGVLVTHEPGEGHSKSEASLRAMEEFGVRKKDMPPHHIVDLARRAGFRDVKVYPFAHDLAELVFRTLRSPSITSRRGRGRWWRIVNRRRRRHEMKPLRELGHWLARSDRIGGITRLVK